MLFSISVIAIHLQLCDQISSNVASVYISDYLVLMYVYRWHNSAPYAHTYRRRCYAAIFTISIIVIYRHLRMEFHKTSYSVKSWHAFVFISFGYISPNRWHCPSVFFKSTVIAFIAPMKRNFTKLKFLLKFILIQFVFFCSAGVAMIFFAMIIIAIYQFLLCRIGPNFIFQVTN